ncbi:MAG: hypothetical protein SXG53_24855 [Pseudomonadota bacterium]|nr:hypothetical protein [Pseudomonadota bacterium]
MSASQAVKFPDVHVQLSGEDGNVFSIIGRVTQALRRAGCAPSEIVEFQKQVQSSQSYDDALDVVMQWVNVS